MNVSDFAFTTPVVERPTSETEPIGVQPGELTQWSLISDDGRASMRLRDTMVIGAGECLRPAFAGTRHRSAPRDGVRRRWAALHNTVVGVSKTRVDGQPLHARQRVGNRATLSFGPHPSPFFAKRLAQHRLTPASARTSSARARNDRPSIRRVTIAPRRLHAGRRRSRGAGGSVSVRSFWPR
jgi:hypothetical protein